MSEHASRLVVVPAKSVGLSLLLTFLFGPLGMLYSTVGGAIVMFFISLFVGFVTAGFGLLLTWPICIIWGAAAVGGYNRRMLAASRA